MHSNPQTVIDRNADMIMKGWDDDKVGVGMVFKGEIPNDIAKGEEIYQNMKGNI